MPYDAFIYDAIRTPRGKGKAGGALHEVKPVSLISGLLEGLKERNDLDTSKVDDVIMGCTTPLGEQGSVLPRIAVLNSSWDQRVTGAQVNRFCASGLETVNLAAMKIASGWEDLVVAGGFESMSREKMASDGGAWYQDPEANVGSEYLPQGISADLLATLDGLTRTDVDNYALQSQQRAAAAQKAGYFDKSLVPVKDRNGIVILDHDELVRPNSSLEGLAKLPAAFEAIGASGLDEAAKLRYPQLERINHVHTGGNSSGIVDGVGLVLLGNEKIGKELGLTPRGRIVATAVIGSEPTVMLTGPVPVTHKVLKKAGLSLGDIDLFELNEAFASVVLHYQKELNIPDEKLNVNGGAIALGHPLGATGAMIVGTCLDELERRQQRYGLVTLCAAAGMGIATIIERI